MRVLIMALVVLTLADLASADSYILAYQGSRLFTWDGEYLSAYQGSRIFEVQGSSVPMMILALPAAGYL